MSNSEGFVADCYSCRCSPDFTSKFVSLLALLERKFIALFASFGFELDDLSDSNHCLDFLRVSAWLAWCFVGFYHFCWLEVMLPPLGELHTARTPTWRSLEMETSKSYRCCQLSSLGSTLHHGGQPMMAMTPSSAATKPYVSYHVGSSSSRPSWSFHLLCACYSLFALPKSHSLLTNLMVACWNGKVAACFGWKMFVSCFLELSERPF